MLTGRDCFIIGSGPSLLNFDFSKLDNVFTIGVNHIVEYYDNLDILLFADRIFLKTINYDLSKFKGMVFAADKATYNPDFKHLKDDWYIFDDNRSNLSKDITKDGLFHPTNSGIMAMNLALIMNARKIYLLGYDYKYRGPQMHFYPDKEHHTRYPEEKFKKKLDKIIHFTPYKNRFINLNLASNLELFERKHWSAVL